MNGTLRQIDGFVETPRGKPLQKIPVSNGEDIVLTDHRGRFTLAADPKLHPIIFVTRPDGTDDARWYTATPHHDGSVKFVLRRRNRPRSSQRTVHIGQFTDTHFSVRSNMPAVARQLRSDFRQLHRVVPDLELLVGTGDMTNRGDIPSLYLLRRIFNHCACPVIPVFGACDGKNEQRELKTALPHIQHWESVMGPTYFSLDVGPWHLIICPEEDAYFGSTRAEIKRRWLEADLARSAGKHVLLAQHPPATAAWLEFLGQRGVKAVICGHWHTSKCYEYAGVRSFCTPPLIIGGVDYMPRGFRTLALGTQKFQVSFKPLTQPQPRKTTLKKQLGVKWTVQVQTCLNRGQPICDAKDVFIPLSDESYSGQSGVLCLDADTGRTRWLLHTTHSIRGTLAITPDRVLAVTQAGQVLAVDRTTGRAAWTRTLSGYPHRWIHTGPVVADDVIVAGTGTGGLEAFKIKSGKPQWRWATSRQTTDYLPHFATPLCLGSTIAVMVYHEGVACLNAKTGRLLWRFKAHYDHCHPAMLLHRGWLLVPDAPGRFHALDPRKRHKGQRLWSRRTGTGELNGWACDDQLLVFNTIEYDLSPGGEQIRPLEHITGGMTQARQAGCGRMLWQRGYGKDLMDVMPHRHGSHALARPLVTPRAIYLAGLDGQIRALDRRTGKRFAALQLGQPIVATASLSSQSLVATTFTGTIARIETKTVLHER